MISIQNRYGVFFLIVCLGFALSGCSGPPSASDGRQAVEDRIKKDSGGRIRLVQFQKTNGQTSEVMGVKVYSLEYETEIEFLEACKWNIITFASALMDSEASFRTTKSPDKPLDAMAQLVESTTNPGTEVSKGQRFKLVGAIRFEKKEKGWSVDGVKVTSITPLTGLANSSATQAARTPENQAAGASKKVTSTLSECREKAEKGDANAQFELGAIYAKGQGVETNLAEAVKWCRKAAEGGHINAQFELAGLYQKGQGVETNMAEAMKWGRKAAEGGHTMSQFILGLMYRDGKYVKQDYAETEKWWRKVADKSGTEAASDLETVTEAQFLLAEVYQKGDGVRQNREMAVALFRKVAASASTNGMPEVAKARLRELDLELRELDPARIESRTCINNLKTIGLALRLWAIDHDGNNPFNASTNSGGTKEFCSLGSDGFDRNAFLHFMVMSNELKSALGPRRALEDRFVNRTPQEMSKFAQSIPMSSERETLKILVCPADSSKHPADDFRSLRAENVTYQMRSGANITETKPEEVVLRCPIHGHVGKCDGSVQSPSMR